MTAMGELRRWQRSPVPEVSYDCANIAGT